MKWIAVLLVGMLGAEAFGVTIARGGKSDCVIVVASDAPPSHQRAAKELQSYLKQICGAELAIVSPDGDLPASAIVLASGPAEKDLGDDGFRVFAIGERLHIVGPGPRGTVYGVYALLEKLGVRWFTPTVTVVPNSRTITIEPWGKEKPAFEYREPYFTEARDKDWAARNRLIGNFIPLDASTGGNIRYADFVHSFDRLVPPKLFKEHPEYFPEIGGKRVNGYVQRCLTNPDVLNLAVEGVKEAFKRNPDARITSVSQNDVDMWCQCAECKKVVAKYGGVQSGIYLWFVNQVAEQIEKELPDKLIDTLAYQFTEAAPTGISPRKNVRVRLCPINVCQAHAYEKDDYAASKAFMTSLAAWHKASGNELYIWHYTTDFGHYLMPFPDFREFPEDARLYARSGVKGVFFQGAYNGPGGSDAELRSWVMSKVLWDPSVDADKLVTEWMQGVYGKAWEPMRKWFDLLHERAGDAKNHFTCYAPPADSLFGGDVLPTGEKLFDEAENLAAGDATASEYVRKSRLWLRYVKIARGAGNEDVAKFVADCKSFGLTNISEGQKLDAWAKAKGAK